MVFAFLKVSVCKPLQSPEQFIRLWWTDLFLQIRLVGLLDIIRLSIEVPIDLNHYFIYISSTACAKLFFENDSK